MRFNSLNNVNVGNYISAGNAAARGAQSISNAINKNKINFTNIINRIRANKGAARREGIKGIGRVLEGRAKNDADVYVNTMRAKREAADKLSRYKGKMAGFIAAAGSEAMKDYAKLTRPYIAPPPPAVIPDPVKPDYSALTSLITQQQADRIALEGGGSPGAPTTAVPENSPPAGATSAVPTAAGGTDIRSQVYTYLTGKHKLTRNQALGIMANIDRESSFRIAPPGGDNGNSFGMLQWNNTYGRSDLMKQNVPDWQTNWKGQLDHALSQNQLPEYSSYITRFKNTDYATPQAAADDFMTYWERPADLEGGSRKHAGFLSTYNF